MNNRTSLQIEQETLEKLRKIKDEKKITYNVLLNKFMIQEEEIKQIMEQQ